MGDQSRPPHPPPQPATGYPAQPNPNGYPPSAGTAYSYPAAQHGGPYAFNYDSHYPSGPQPPYALDAYSLQRANFLRRVVGVILACFFMAGTILFIVWLAFRPQLPEFRVDSLSVSDFNLSSNFLSANWDLKFTARNPNKKMTVYYEDIQASILYGDSELLAGTSLAPFAQDTKSETASKGTFTASGTFVDDWVVKGINRDKSNVDFNVILVTRVWFKTGSWRTKRRILRVYCRDLKVQLLESSAHSGNHTAQRLSSGNLVRAPKQCRVGF
ncbi:unnamed protein product [Cuscuta campestris]|uniref:Late embryogenesis abundant protein LEA-2 subgroup domain-containing protein n=1 Tax=Cuscuta campestris TaxID=132261 RepID=A0A484NN69_9ASTE|nr:unnamed protein product [Cuscuta campestris]